jgi:hypothetical protein
VTAPSTFERWASDPIEASTRVLRSMLEERRRWAPGTHGRRNCARIVRARVARIRAHRAGGFRALIGIE